MSSPNWLTPGVLLGIGYDTVLVAVTAVITWYVRGWREKSRSFKIDWADLPHATRDVGQFFLITATIHNLTDQTRPFMVELAGASPNREDVFDDYQVGLEYAVRLAGRPAVPPHDMVALSIRVPAVRYGTSEIGFRVTGTKGIHQRYQSRVYLLRVEKPHQSDWTSMSTERRLEFAVSILARVYERWPKSSLTRDRIVEFYDMVESGKMVIMGGATWQFFPGHFTKRERRYLLLLARALGVSIRWAERSEPLGFWAGLFFRNA